MPFVVIETLELVEDLTPHGVNVAGAASGGRLGDALEQLPLSREDAWTGALACLERLSDTQLQSLKVKGLHQIQLRVRQRMSRDLAKKAAAEAARAGVAAAPVADMHAAVEADEDGDDVLEPTPLEVVREPREGGA